jgi:heavy metal efflux system protein
MVMVSYFNRLRDEGETSYHAVLKGAMARLRTVLMTALLAMLGLPPMALSHGIGSETQKPLAVAIIGGLISATLLTLFVLPALYLVFNRDDLRKTPLTGGVRGRAEKKSKYIEKRLWDWHEWDL